MTFNSVWYALIITAVTLLVSYPAAYFLHYTKHKQLWLLLLIMPTWINLLLKAYAFIGILGKHGASTTCWVCWGWHRISSYLLTPRLFSWRRTSKFRS